MWFLFQTHTIRDFCLRILFPYNFFTHIHTCSFTAIVIKTNVRLGYHRNETVFHFFCSNLVHKLCGIFLKISYFCLFPANSIFSINFNSLNWNFSFLNLKRFSFWIHLEYSRLYFLRKNHYVYGLHFYDNNME